MTRAHDVLRLMPNKNKHYAGGRELDRFRGIPADADDNRPEAWVGSAARVLGEPVDAGLARALPADGTAPYLRDLMAADPAGMLGEEHAARWGAEPALLVKLLDAGGPLTLQCHPDGDYARARFGAPFGKQESWYVLSVREDAPQPPSILLGFRQGITRARFEQYYRSGDRAAMEALCHRIPVTPGDMFLVPPGVPHAIGAGCFLVETQEPSDITVFALRERNEDDEAALGCFDYAGRSREDTLALYKVSPRTLRREAGGEERLLLGPRHSARFAVTGLRMSGSMAHRDTGAFCIGIVTGGAGRVGWEGGSLAVGRGQELFIPAGARDVVWTAEGLLELVLCHPPTAVPGFRSLKGDGEQ